MNGSGTSPPTLLVDAHAHIFTHEMPLIENPRHTPGYSFPLEEYLAQLDAHGVSRGVIAAASPWGDYNDYTRESVKTHRDRLRGTVILHPEKLDTYPLQAMTDDGIVGIRLPFIGLRKLPDIRSREYRRLFSVLADIGWHIHLHVEGRHIPALLPHLLNAGPRLVIDHLGRPEPDRVKEAPGFKPVVEAINDSKAWLKVSCGYRIGDVASEHFLAFLHECGEKRLFWASDSPFVGHEGELDYKDTILWLDNLLDDVHSAERIFGRNALDFYFDT